MRMILLPLIATVLYAQDYTVATYGPPAVYAGSHLYHQLNVSYASTVGYLYLDSCSGSGTITCRLLCVGSTSDEGDACSTEATGSHRQHFASAANPQLLALDIAVPSNTTPGSHTATATVTANSIQHAVTISFTVRARPSAPTRSTIRPVEIPLLKPWEATMLDQADARCKHQTACSPGGADCGFGNEGEVWYYDATRNYYRIADYFGDAATWTPCAAYHAQQYKARIQSSPIQGWRKFPKGMYEAYRHTGDASYSAALIDRLHYGSAYSIASTQWDLLDEDYLREAAYALDTYVYARLLGQPRTERGERLVDYLLGHMEIVLSPAYRLHQTFFDGLAMEALIEYHTRISPDPRIPATIKRVLDWIWTSAWDLPAHPKALMMNPATYSPSAAPFCFWGCADPTADSDSYNTQLNLLVAPAFAWYWWLTGDDTYRARGDDLWTYAMRAVPFTVTGGKIYIKRHGLWDGAWIKVYPPTSGTLGQLTSSGLWSTQELYVRNPKSDSFQWAGTPTGTPSTGSGDGSGIAVFFSWANYFSTGKQWSQNARWGFDYVYWRTNEYRWLKDSRRQIGRSGVAGRVGR